MFRPIYNCFLGRVCRYFLVKVFEIPHHVRERPSWRKGLLINPNKGWVWGGVCFKGRWRSSTTSLHGSPQSTTSTIQLTTVCGRICGPNYDHFTPWKWKQMKTPRIKYWFLWTPKMGEGHFFKNNCRFLGVETLENSTWAVNKSGPLFLGQDQF